MEKLEYIDPFIEVVGFDAPHSEVVASSIEQDDDEVEIAPKDPE